ncbi:MAG: PhoH family protein [Ferrovibrio sp.]|nr:PhoH family protein [Ferrovibrio sp.]
MARARYDESQEREEAAPVQTSPSSSVQSATSSATIQASTPQAGADMQILGKHIANGPTSPAISSGRAAREAAERAAERAAASDARLPEGAVRTKKRVILPRSPTQGRYISELLKHELVFGLGPAGTGKTYLAVAVAVTMLLEGRVDRIILSRPAVEAGERLGFLPGDMREKIDPYLRPLYDALYDMLPPERVVKGLESGEIEVAPLAFMRGRTLANAFVILDEAQNTSPVQMKMLLTRLGENSRLVVTGDLSQIDLPLGVPSGLRDALDILDGVDGISFVRFNESDVVRHPLVTKVVRAYAQREQQLGLQRPDPGPGTRRRG